MKLRRGIVEHVEQRKLTEREYAAYTMLILCASHNNGHWRGCGAALAAKFGYGARTGQRALKSLAAKGYIRLPHKIPAQGNYSIGIVKYFERASVVTGRASTVTAFPQKRASVVTPIQEVSQNLKEESIQEEMPNQSPARDFKRFYDSYPEERRGDETYGQVEWNAIPAIDMDVDAILAGLAVWKHSEQWVQDGGRYVPKLARFLKERLWKHPPREKTKGENEYERQVRKGWR